ncbi:MAG: aldehyde dehydrogenase family protein [Clostridiales Family XIII bacterium]|jgi:acyl-CoA reductase-like NAD-dependent aldehyde dehydrogenase|nr:aldehyde dehydrogenase family protein [Clostridiales Family XIII bacterium]
MNSEYKVLIGGRLKDAVNGGTMEVINPANGNIVAVVPKCDEEDVELAVAAAQGAKEAWRNTYIGERAELIYKLAAIVRAHEAELIPLETAQYGGPISKTSKFDIPFAAKEFEFIAGLGRGMVGTTISADPDARVMTLREPHGVVGLITPWNFPLVTAVSKLAPALITGNTVVLKPASCAPLTVLKLGEYIIEAGIPEGVVNILTGPGQVVGEAIVKHPGVAKINFTGDSAVGKRIMTLAADRVMPVASELGGKNAMIVLDDADLYAAVEGAVHGSFFNSGQNCGSPSRFYVQEGIYDEFVSRFVESASKVTMGDPLDPDTMIGPLAYMGCRAVAEGFIKDAKEAGTKVLLGGEPVTDPKLINGAYVTPTIFGVTDNKIPLMQEEIFAPVVGIMKITTPEEGVRLTNDSRYGLCASIWTEDYRRGLKLLDGLDVGTAWINQHLAIVPETPWGGRKESGWTKENSFMVLDEYTYQKHIWINMAESPKTFWHDRISL